MLFEQNIASNVTRNEECKYIKSETTQNHTFHQPHETTQNLTKPCKTSQIHMITCKNIRNQAKPHKTIMGNLLELRKLKIFDFHKMF